MFLMLVRYHTCIEFRGLNFRVFVWQKIRGVLIFVAIVGTIVVGFAKYANMLAIVD